MEFPFGTTEEMSEIDKIRVQSAPSIFCENGLPVVGVIGTNVDHPCQPEVFAVTNPIEAGSGEDF